MLTQGLDLVTVIPAAVIEALIAHHLDGLALQARLAVEYNGHHAPALAALPEAPEPPRKPLAPATRTERLYDPARLERLRAQRRRKKA